MLLDKGVPSGGARGRVFGIQHCCKILWGTLCSHRYSWKHIPTKSVIFQKVSNSSSMDSNKGKQQKWKQRKRVGRHGKGQNGTGKRGGQSNKNKCLFYKHPTAHERIRILDSVLCNPDVINHIGEFLSYSNYAALRFMYKMTSVKDCLYHRQMLKRYERDVDNATDKFCVPLIPQTGTYVAQFSVMVYTLLCPETPSMMIMFGFRIFNPERKLWIDIAMNEHGHVYCDD